MEKKKGFIAEFKEFISRGSVIDLAVGVIIGGAFTTIVNSLVNDIVMPIIGLLIGGMDFTSLKIVLGTNEDGTAATINYGMFIQNVVNFLLMAFVIFCVVKFINGLRRKEEATQEPEPEAPAEPSEDILLLREIRDSLKK